MSEARSSADFEERPTIDLDLGCAGNVNSANRASTSVAPAYDIVVIGGGIHGVGVAQAGAAAGYSVAVLEKSRLAEGTSSRSSKLIHGGLRYLEGLQLSLVRESLRERELLLRLAPELVERQKFFIPVYEHTRRSPLTIKLGLLLYSTLAGGRKGTRFRTVPRKEWTSLDGLETRGLRTVLEYQDAQTDDAALTRAVMQSAQDLGADLFYPARFEAAQIDGDGVDVTFRIENREVTTRASTIVNAAGPWANAVLSRIIPRVQPLQMDHIQGTHIECPGEMKRGCYYVEAADDRVVFVMPWRDRTMIGTTEVECRVDPDLVTPLDHEVAYLREIFESHFPTRDSRVVNKWTGIRALPRASGSAFRRTRETQLPVDDEANPRVITIFGGKLTGYRATAQKVTKILRRQLGRCPPAADTRKLRLIDPDASSGSAG